MEAVINRTWGFSCLWLFFSFPCNEKKKKIIFMKCLIWDNKYLLLFHLITITILQVQFTDKAKVTEVWKCQVICPRPHS